MACVQVLGVIWDCEFIFELVPVMGKAVMPARVSALCVSQQSSASFLEQRLTNNTGGANLNTKTFKMFVLSKYHQGSAKVTHKTGENNCKSNI
jgi:hypothetical protein